MANVKHPQTNLRSLAKQAKSRLTQNDYVKERQDAVASALPILERKLYYKIAEIIDHENELLNPIAALIDREAFERLSPVERQRELFRLSDLYRRVKQALAK